MGGGGLVVEVEAVVLKSILKKQLSMSSAASGDPWGMEADKESEKDSGTQTSSGVGLATEE